jgi:starch phosphorylase
MLTPYLPGDVKSLESSFVRHVELSLARRRENCDSQAAFHALAMSVRDHLLERWKATQEFFFEKDCKRVAYLSMEFLMGRTLQNAIYNLGLRDAYAEAMRNLGFRLEDLAEEESDAGLGNGGLGRLAACFLDSLASLDLPAWGYGLRYTYGMFHQEIQRNEQIEFPDFWLVAGNPWELERMDVCFPVKFYGRVQEAADGSRTWVDTEDVVAMAYDTPVPGYDTFNALNIRLWSAKPSMEFDLEHFNKGNFFESVKVEAQQLCGQLSRLTPFFFLSKGSAERGADYAGAVSQRQHARGQGAAPQAAVLFRQRHAAGFAAPLSASLAADSGAAEQAGGAAQRHAPDAGPGGADALSARLREASV